MVTNINIFDNGWLGIDGVAKQYELPLKVPFLLTGKMGKATALTSSGLAVARCAAFRFWWRFNHVGGGS